MLKNKRLWRMVGMTALLLTLSTAIVYADPAGGGLSDINNGNALMDLIKKMAIKFSDNARSIIGFLVAVVLIWGALLLVWGGTDGNKVAATKEYYKYAVLALVIVVAADKIVGWFMGLLT